jgi:hypothetical protein
VKQLRIFISSPGDVSDERERARQVVHGLRRRYSNRAELIPIFWEDLPLSAGMSFQEGIDRVLSEDAGVDIAVFILWSRLGTPIGPSLQRADGSEYRSGTERELALMLEASRMQGGRRPHLLAYTR